MTSGDNPKWVYQPDQWPKKKHHWSYDVAGFKRISREIKIGKCPKSLSEKKALVLLNKLLNEGITWSPKNWRRNYPQRIYNIFKGQVYRAMPTNPGYSYHGFPERSEDLPPELRQPIIELAKTMGCFKEIEKWLNTKT